MSEWIWAFIVFCLVVAVLVSVYAEQKRNEQRWLEVWKAIEKLARMK